MRFRALFRASDSRRPRRAARQPWPRPPNRSASAPRARREAPAAPAEPGENTSLNGGKDIKVKNRRGDTEREPRKDDLAQRICGTIRRVSG
eukprot:6194545-Pleurochrysis_carterae.AAC.3